MDRKAKVTQLRVCQAGKTTGFPIVMDAHAFAAPITLWLVAHDKDARKQASRLQHPAIHGTESVSLSRVACGLVACTVLTYIGCPLQTFLTSPAYFARLVWFR